MTTAARPTRPLRPALNLDYPTSLNVYDDYSRAQHVVDYLADHDFQSRTSSSSAPS
jgi:hypothetical protein